MKNKSNNINYDSLWYRSPRIKVVEVNVQGILCQSQPGENTEKFNMSGYSYSDEDFE